MATGWPFWKWHCWKSMGFYPYISVMCCWSMDLIFKAKLKLLQKLKNPIWPPGSHFENDIAENHYASAYSHKWHAHEIWNWNSKANLNWAAMNHMGYNGSFAMFKKEVKKFIIENDVSLSCLWCLIDIIHWMYHCNLLYSETIVRKCSPETSGCVVVPSRYWFKYWLGAWPASSQCMGQLLLINNRTKNKGGTTTYS